MRTYEESLKTYWDTYSVLETARNEGKKEGMIEVAREMKKEGDTLEKISRITGLTLDVHPPANTKATGIAGTPRGSLDGLVASVSEKVTTYKNHARHTI